MCSERVKCVLLVLAGILVAGPAQACPIEIDIIPGAFPNVVNMEWDCTIVVALIAPSVDSLLPVNPAWTRLTHDRDLYWYGGIPLQYWWEDIDGDGDMDMLFEFSVFELIEKGVLTESTTELMLVAPGNFDDYWPDSICQWNAVEGTDSIEVSFDPMTIGDFVWQDLDEDGVQDDGEPGIADVVVNLYDAADNLIATTVTDANGLYGFEVWEAGTYYVEVEESTLPSGLSPTLIGAANDTALDSNENGSEVVLSCEMPNDLTIDFGYTGCEPCDGKVTALTLEYLGDVVDAHIQVKQKKSVTGTDFAFDGIVGPGELFSFVGLDKKGTLHTEIKIYVNGEFNTSIHTSCSQPIGPGLVSGDFLVIDGASRNGGLLCPVGDEDDGCNGCNDGCGHQHRHQHRHGHQHGHQNKGAGKHGGCK